jgi:hypothetical protein
MWQSNTNIDGYVTIFSISRIIASRTLGAASIACHKRLQGSASAGVLAATSATILSCSINVVSLRWSSALLDWKRILVVSHVLFLFGSTLIQWPTKSAPLYTLKNSASPIRQIYIKAMPSSVRRSRAVGTELYFFYYW